ncbi:NAD-dependent epimerase/dehydratase family protein [Plantactinospora sp. GCM10030261]|uniref:NAD-dependent epimerase/dehydratase family protein n=1 Tax=Plantactinospora sp. GCM10030261 TaxID=3273420 RepID=UPI003611E27C
MTTVLLFGASGFLGRYVRASLAPHADLVCPSRSACDLVASDVTALASAIRAARPDAIVNCAGRVSGSGSDLIQAHTVVTAKLIDAVVAAAPGARFLRIGSAAEYGRVPHGAVVREDHTAVPISEYGVSQLAATHLADIAGRSGRVDTIVLRVFNPVGAGLPATSLLGHTAHSLRRAMARGSDYVEIGLLDSHRDFVDVRDVASAVRAAVFAPSDISSRVFNVASGRTVTLREAVETLVTVSGFPGEVRTGTPSAHAARSAGVGWMRGDITTIARELAWRPTYELIDSLKFLWADTEPVPGDSGTSLPGGRG